MIGQVIGQVVGQVVVVSMVGVRGFLPVRIGGLEPRFGGTVNLEDSLPGGMGNQGLFFQRFKGPMRLLPSKVGHCPSGTFCVYRDGDRFQSDRLHQAEPFLQKILVAGADLNLPLGSGGTGGGQQAKIHFDLG